MDGARGRAHLNSTARRGRDGPIAHLQQLQPLHWGRGTSRNGAPPRPQGITSRVRVLKVGNGRQLVYDLKYFALC